MQNVWLRDDLIEVDKIMMNTDRMGSRNLIPRYDGSIIKRLEFKDGEEKSKRPKGYFDHNEWRISGTSCQTRW